MTVSVTNKMFKRVPAGRLAAVGLMAVLIHGCGSAVRTPEAVQEKLAVDGLVTFPPTWERATSPSTDVTSHCVVPGPNLQALLDQALTRNLTLQALRSQAEEARLNTVVARADRLPTLSASLSTTRRRVNANLFQAPEQTYTLGIDAQFELDMWGRLSDAQRQAHFSYRAAQYAYEDSLRTILRDVARAWFNVVFARDLADVLEQRVVSVRNNLDVVEQSYRQGINTALDVYLARTSLAQEETRLAQQRQTLAENTSVLQLLLNEYPSGTMEVAESLAAQERMPQPDEPVAVIENRPDVQQAWVQLLAQDAAVAVAHKQRFPRLVFSANVDDLEQDISEIIDGQNVVWSLVANMTQPLFQAGRLKALEQQAREQLARTELNYTGLLQQAFGEVEDALGATQALDLQMAASIRAADASEAAYELSFQQYRRGLVTYTTVLQSEQRAFDAASSLLELRYRQRLNRIDLCAALGEFPRLYSDLEEGAE